ncbi:histidinol-phosphatase [bacterium]|nr:histidinol-phosphatase [bacterium]
MSSTGRHSHVFLTVLFCLVMVSALSGQTRDEPRIPDIPGYVTLKCDFHTHTVFSDGSVWPTVRVDEAWREGLDVIAITDHLEYQPHKKDVAVDHNRPYELARSRAASLGLILVRGTEITRRMPPGHFNALFIEDAAALDKPEFLDAVEAAVSQGAFILWNHPGWKGQQPDGVSRWYDIHTTLLEKGWLHGIETVNSVEYYPAVQDWCLEKDLTMVGNSDIHAPTFLSFDFAGGEHRAMTLVFAEERTREAVRDAMFAGRTAIYFKQMVIGKQEYLEPLARGCFTLRHGPARISGTGSCNLWLTNTSDIPLYFETDGEDPLVSGPESLSLPPRSTVLFRIAAREDHRSGTFDIRLPYRLTNFKTAGAASLRTEIHVSVTLTE